MKKLARNQNSKHNNFNIYKLDDISFKFLFYRFFLVDLFLIKFFATFLSFCSITIYLKIILLVMQILKFKIGRQANYTLPV